MLCFIALSSSYLFGGAVKESWKKFLLPWYCICMLKNLNSVQHVPFFRVLFEIANDFFTAAALFNILGFLVKKARKGLSLLP